MPAMVPIVTRRLLWPGGEVTTRTVCEQGVTRPTIKPPDYNHTRTNEATLDEKHMRGSGEYEASQHDAATADTQRLELMRTTTESSKLYDWVDWGSDKTKRMFP